MSEEMWKYLSIAGIVLCALAVVYLMVSIIQWKQISFKRIIPGYVLLIIGFALSYYTYRVFYVPIGAALCIGITSGIVLQPFFNNGIPDPIKGNEKLLIRMVIIAVCGIIPSVAVYFFSKDLYLFVSMLALTILLGSLTIFIEFTKIIKSNPNAQEEKPQGEIKEEIKEKSIESNEYKDNIKYTPKNLKK
jgi:hypothetical protein